MSVHAGSILHLGGQNVIDRIQSAGLGDVRLPIEAIREVGNREIVDKITAEPDFTFTMESFNTSTELMAFLTGATGGSGSAAVPGGSDPAGTSYDWLDCQFVNIASPWKDPDSGSAGTIEAGHLVPGYYPTRLRYRFGVTDNATQEVELSGGAFFYGRYTPVEQQETGDGVEDEFDTNEDAIQYRIGGSSGSTFKSIFGVLIDGDLQTPDVDYTLSGGAADPGSTATITFTEAPENGADIRFCYFTADAHAYPQTVHADINVIPGAVRGRNIQVYVEGQRVGGIQAFELEATVDGEVERELGTEEIVGRVINGTDTNGTMTVRSKDTDAFFDLLEDLTGVDADTELVGWFNNNTVDLQVKIENPKDPGTILKTLAIEDAKFQIPGTPSRVNTPTDFSISWESNNGTFKEYKGEPA